MDQGTCDIDGLGYKVYRNLDATCNPCVQYPRPQAFRLGGKGVKECQAVE